MNNFQTKVLLEKINEIIKKFHLDYSNYIYDDKVDVEKLLITLISMGVINETELVQLLTSA